MNSETYHILQQTEWYNRFIKTYKFVELEHWFYNYKVDVYAETKDDKIIIIEIGTVEPLKLDMLCALAETGKITLIRRLIPENFRIHKILNRDIVTDTVFPKNYKWKYGTIKQIDNNASKMRTNGKFNRK